MAQQQLTLATPTPTGGSERGSSWYEADVTNSPSFQQSSRSPSMRATGQGSDNKETSDLLSNKKPPIAYPKLKVCGVIREACDE